MNKEIFVKLLAQRQFKAVRSILDVMNELALAEAQIEQNGNGKIILLDLSIKLYRLLKK